VKKIAEQNGGKYEMAVYAAQCGNLKRLLPICTYWEVTSCPSQTEISAYILTLF